MGGGRSQQHSDPVLHVKRGTSTLKKLFLLRTEEAWCVQLTEAGLEISANAIL